MSETRLVTSGGSDQSQAELVREIKKNLASLKTAMDTILEDMNDIRNTRVEILERFDSLKNDNTSAQIEQTLSKAKRIVKKSDENRYRLELVLKRMSDIHFIHSFTGLNKPDDLLNGNAKTTSTDVKTKHLQHKANMNNINSGHEKIRLRLLDNNKYMLTEASDNKFNVEKEKNDVKWGKDSALKELQWIVKMKLYKLRHHYERLPYDQTLEETPLPVSWRQGRSRPGVD